MEPIQGRCGSCRKTWKLPAGGRAYTCKACGGNVWALGEGPAAAPPGAAKPPPLPGAPLRRTSVRKGTPRAAASRDADPAEDAEGACLACGAALAADDAFCTDCGAARGGAATQDETEQERAAHVEYGRVKPVVGLLRALFVAGGFYATVLFVFILYIMQNLVRYTHATDLEVEVSWALPWAIYGGVMALYIAGWIGARSHPLAWSIVLAGLQTVGTGLQVANGAGPISIVFSLLFTLAHWAAVQRAARLEAVLKRYPKLRERSSKGRSVGSGRVVARRKEDRRQDRLRMLKLAGVGVVLAAIVAVGIHLLSRPPRVESIVVSFETAWNSNDRKGVMRHIASDASDTRPRQLESALRQRGWAETLPKIERLGLTGETRVFARWRTPLGEMTGEFVLEEGNWSLSGLALPVVVASSPQATVQEFEAAWDAGAHDKIVGLMDPDGGDRMPSAWRRTVERREWSEGYPKPIRTFVDWRTGATTAESTHAFSDGSVEATWKFRGTTWFLSGLKVR